MDSILLEWNVFKNKLKNKYSDRRDYACNKENADNGISFFFFVVHGFFRALIPVQSLCQILQDGKVKVMKSTSGSLP